VVFELQEVRKGLSELVWKLRVQLTEKDFATEKVPSQHDQNSGLFHYQ